MATMTIRNIDDQIKKRPRVRAAEHGRSFDSDAADRYAEIAGARKQGGRPISQFDAMIAAVACSRRTTLASRNVKNFVDCGVNMIDPWSA